MRTARAGGGTDCTRQTGPGLGSEGLRDWIGGEMSGSGGQYHGHPASSTSPSATALRHLEPFTGMAAHAAVRGLRASSQPDWHESISRAPPPAGPAIPTAGTGDSANCGKCYLRLERVAA